MTSALVAVAAAVAMITPGVPGASAADDPVPVVFILDASGSMVREVAAGTTRMDVAKQATIDTLEGLPASARVGMLVFGTGTGNTDAERAAGCEDVTTLAPLGRLDAAALGAKIRAVKESGFTPIGPALRKAAAMLPADATGEIVLVSDGVDTCSPPSSCQVASELHRANPLLSIHVVAFGVDDDEAAQQQLTCIGRVGGGTAVSATDPAQLAARLRAASSTTATASQLGLRGLRGVEIGMSLDEVRARVDGAKVGDPVTRDGVVVVLVDCGWGTVELHDDRVYSITPQAAETGTAEGVVPGDTLARAEALYGAPVDNGTTVGGVSNVYRAAPGSTVGYRVFYDPKTDEIRYIVVCRCVPFDVARAAAKDWEITYDGVGPLVLGMSAADAQAAVPGLVGGDVYDGRQNFFLDDVNGGQWLSAEIRDDALVSVSVSDPRFDGETVDGAYYPSARGIRLGEAGATAVNAFPGGTYYRSLAGGIAAYMVLDREGRLITFSTWPRPGSAELTESESIQRGWIHAITVEDATATR